MMSVFYWYNILIKYSTIRIHIEVDCILKVLNDASFNNHLCSIISYRVNHIYKDHYLTEKLILYPISLSFYNIRLTSATVILICLLLGLPTTAFIIRLNKYFILPFNFNYSSRYAKGLKW